MARNIIDIKNEMTATFMADETLAARYGFSVGTLFTDEFSMVSFENILLNVVAFSIFILEKLFDLHQTEVQTIIEQDKAHRPLWYVTMAKKFQYGFSLTQDTDQYDNMGFTDDQVANSKVIKYAAITPSAGRILIKIATENAGVLTPVTHDVKLSFDAYIAEIADCGVKYIIVNSLPDILKLTLKIYRDPLVLTDTGMSILNGNYPVEDAINEYMKELPFNGELVLVRFIDKLQLVQGVVIPNLINAESQSIDISTNVYQDLVPINVKTVPSSGYFTRSLLDNISYVV